MVVGLERSSNFDHHFTKDSAAYIIIIWFLLFTKQKVCKKLRERFTLAWILAGSYF
jgi:hypothetical protein